MDPQANDLANKTLAEAIDSLMTMGSPFLPIVLVQKDGQRQLQRIMSDHVEEAAAAARQIAASQTDADASAFAIDGVIPYDGARFDAIVVEAWNFRTGMGARIGLRYELTGVRKKKPSLIGSPLHLGSDGWFDPEDEGVAAVQPAYEEAVYAQPVIEEQVFARPEFEQPVEEPVYEQPESQQPVYEQPVFEEPEYEQPVYPVPLYEAPEPAAAPDFGPPPEASTLAPADIAPPPPPGAFPPPEHPAPEQPATQQPAIQPPTQQPAPDFGPPPTTPPVALDPPPSYSAAAVPAAPAPDAAPQADPESDPEPDPELAGDPDSAAAPEPAPSTGPPGVPLQRSETPLGNRAMFAGIMELATKGRSFPAFAIVQKGGAWEQVTMTDPSLAEAAASVRAYARSRTDAEFIAFAIDGHVEVDGASVAAVIVEVWEYSTRVSFSVAQRYIPTGSPPSPRLSGRPLMRTKEGWVDVPSSMSLGGQILFAYSEPDES